MSLVRQSTVNLYQRLAQCFGRNKSLTGDDVILSFDWDDLANDGETWNTVEYRVKRHCGGEKQVVYVEIVSEGIIPQEKRNCMIRSLINLRALPIWKGPTWRNLGLRVEDGTIHSQTDLYPPHGLPGYYGLTEDFLRSDLPKNDLLDLKYTGC